MESDRIVDTNVWLGSWPLLFGGDVSADMLESERQRQGFDHMLVSPLTALLNEVPDDANNQAKKALVDRDRLEYVPVANPTIPYWFDSVFAGNENPPIRYLRIAPTYHCYELSPLVSGEIGSVARKQKCVVLLQMRMEDERNQNKILKTTPPSTHEIISLAEALDPIPLIVNSLYLSEIPEVVGSTANVLVDISFAEGFRSLQTVLNVAPVDRVVFGSNFPVFFAGAARAKVTSWDVNAQTRDAVAVGNFRSALARVESLPPLH